MPIYVYQGNSQISTNAIRNDKAVKSIYAVQKDTYPICVWGEILDTIFSYNVSNNTVTITSVKSYKNASSLYVPSTIKGLPVVAISDRAFQYMSSLKEVIIPNSVTSIGEGVFKGCSSLESITLPFIGKQAGLNSSSLYQYPLGYIFGTDSYTDGIKVIQKYYGSSTTNYTQTAYYIPKTLKTVIVTGDTIHYGAFTYCNLSDIILYNGVTGIDEYGCVNCYAQTISIPDSVTDIGKGAFSSSNFTNITFPTGLTTIPEYCLSSCRSLQTITIPNSITFIEGFAFDNCTSLKSITFNGTKAQWYAVQKQYRWDNNTGNYTIHCTDGDIPKQ